MFPQVTDDAFSHVAEGREAQPARGLEESRLGEQKPCAGSKVMNLVPLAQPRPHMSTGDLLTPTTVAAGPTAASWWGRRQRGTVGSRVFAGIACKSILCPGSHS